VTGAVLQTTQGSRIRKGTVAAKARSRKRLAEIGLFFAMGGSSDDAGSIQKAGSVPWIRWATCSTKPVLQAGADDHRKFQVVGTDHVRVMDCGLRACIRNASCRPTSDGIGSMYLRRWRFGSTACLPKQ